ncbi:hypothetical protein BU24DRAFT_20253 [Aaosphaeria arxii CBS 175.79]|uniref:DUF7730 domain-containing protein n=1 Tax=Aaosphaeria arxii CBS 175.79 TaxID=1450172 RepID=A0A6A5Y8Q4_9PLEO|nr:uncharacterized protein BU24DRAFT_20253 [Aaosphaeria arxii CBS 175.79]KAF2021387.1 hypothetical protein BU24DRAFT_20253 [Aaosphaeria arxii CBS 175.79]
MRLFFANLLRRKRDQRKPSSEEQNAPKPRSRSPLRAPWPLPGSNEPIPPVHPQFQSPLIRKLSPEFRLLIYQFALGDPSAPIHICKNTTPGLFRRQTPVMSYRCINPYSPFPTWQHSTCFLEKRGFYDGYWRSVRVDSFHTNCKLFDLLLTCRLIYSEALKILYEHNIFAFREPEVLTAFKGFYLEQQWLSIRHIKLSVDFSARFYDEMSHDYSRFRPPSLLPWQNCCQSLGHMSNLFSLTIEITINENGCQLVEGGEEFIITTNEILSSDHKESRFNFEQILTPLMAVHARRFVLELNTKIPDRLQAVLEAEGIELSYPQRPQDLAVYYFLVPSNL